MSRYGEVQSYLKLLSGSALNDHLSYSFNFDHFSVDNNIIESLKNHIRNVYLANKSADFHFVLNEELEWQTVLSVSLGEFDLNEEYLSRFLSLFEDFIENNTLRVWQITSDLFWGVYQKELLFKVENMYYYLLMYITD
ncbi:hypothetical protein A8708_05560 [Paenibacillus oryzisoli]|uniref:Uncharacterized protein n=1 Tax=Paenibacillus oryzisoli TaxID=1850517 RepID=A0A198A4S6_9BACL|nr:hypothetical protein A8708_05560 [Paenibacillus oryzisoli]